MAQFILDLGHRTAYGEADFLVAPCNETAVAWIDRWPAWPGPALALYGPAGCGKTHLAHVWQARAGASFIKREDLRTDSVPDLLGAASSVILDDAEGVEEEALLHLYNVVAERGGSLLLTATRAPAHWMVVLPDLRSRLLAAAAVPIAPPDDALLGGVLKKLFADRQLAVGEEVILFLLRQMERSFEAARRVVRELDEAALTEHRSITVPLARRIFGAGT